MQEFEPTITAKEAHKAFANIFDTAANLNNLNQKYLHAIWLDTRLGPMVAIADEEALFLLEFVTKKRLEKEIYRLKKLGYVMIPGSTPPLKSIEKELKAYFNGSLKEFKTPYKILGTPFQKRAWDALCKIPYGTTTSYAKLSSSLGLPKSYRAVANANGANQLVIIVPCHRVIASNGSLGGYSCGIEVKQWLLEHEKNLQ